MVLASDSMTVLRTLISDYDMIRVCSSSEPGLTIDIIYAESCLYETPDTA